MTETTMTELKVNVPELPKVQSNFEQIKAEVATIVAKYEVIIYDDITQARKDRAQLNKLKGDLDTARKATKKLYNAPFVEFEKQVKALMESLDGAMQGIDFQIATAEKVRTDKRKADIEAHFATMGFPEGITLEQIWSDRWLSSKTMRSVKTAMNTALKNINDAIGVIHGLGSYVDETIAKYKSTLDLTDALSYRNSLIEAQRQELERQVVEPQVAESSLSAVPPHEVTTTPVVQAEPRKWVAFAALMSASQVAELEMWFKHHNIVFSKG